MSIALPCGYVAPDSCDLCKQAAYELIFKMWSGEWKICSGCLEHIFDVHQAVSEEGTSFARSLCEQRRCDERDDENEED